MNHTRFMYIHHCSPSYGRVLHDDCNALCYLSKVNCSFFLYLWLDLAWSSASPFKSSPLTAGAPYWRYIRTASQEASSSNGSFYGWDSIQLTVITIWNVGSLPLLLPSITVLYKMITEDCIVQEYLRFQLTRLNYRTIKKKRNVIYQNEEALSYQLSNMSVPC